MALPRQVGFAAAVVLAALLISTTPARGQLQQVVSSVFGTGSSSPSSPSTPTVVSTTTPSTTPAATAAGKTISSTTTPAAKAAAATAAAPTVTPVKTPAPTKKASPSPPPPAPIVIDQSKLVPALPADETVESPSLAPAPSGPAVGNTDQTAADAVLQVSGPGVTPFVIPQQTVLLRAMASILTTVSLSDLRIRYVTSQANSRRRLLEEDSQAHRTLLALSPAAAAAAAASGQLVNVASVTLEANCTNSAAVPATLEELQSVVNNNLLASAIQAYGEPQWGVTLLSLTAVNPNIPLAQASSCKKSFGSFCLDGTSLSVAAVEVIIAIGAIVIVMLITVPCVYLEWRRKSGQMAELEPTPATPKSPLDRMQLIYNNLINTVKAASPLHRQNGNGRSAFQSETPNSAKASEKAGVVELTARPQ